jgi:hypothetical protein
VIEAPHGDTFGWLKITAPEGAKEILRDGLQVPLVSVDRLRARRK